MAVCYRLCQSFSFEISIGTVSAFPGHPLDDNRLMPGRFDGIARLSRTSQLMRQLVCHISFVVIG